MRILDRIARLMAANLNHLLEEEEDPDRAIKRIIREMESSIVDLRRETVRAVARERQAARNLEELLDEIETLEDRALAAVREGLEDAARDLLREKRGAEEKVRSLQPDLDESREEVRRLKADLDRLEDQVQAARRKKEELVRRRRLADESARIEELGLRSAGAIRAALDKAEKADPVRYDPPLDVERELRERERQREETYRASAEEAAIDEELERLKKEIE